MSKRNPLVMPLLGVVSLMLATVASVHASAEPTDRLDRETLLASRGRSTFGSYTSTPCSTLNNNNAAICSGGAASCTLCGTANYSAYGKGGTGYDNAKRDKIGGSGAGTSGTCSLGFCNSSGIPAGPCADPPGDPVVQ